MSEQPHDRLFHGVFAGAAQAAALIRGLLPSAVVDRLDFGHFIPASGTVVGADLSGRAPDRVFETRLGGWPAFIRLVVEHQCTSPVLMPVRVAGSAIRVIERSTRESGGSGGVPLVVTIVVYHGDRPWTAPLRLSEMTGVPEAMRTFLAPVLPDVGYFLVDLRGIPEEEIMRGVGALDAWAALTLLAMKAAYVLDVVARFPAWKEVIREVAEGPGGIERLAFVLCYLAEIHDHLALEDLKRVLDRELGPEAEVALVTLAERLRKEGEARGETRGKAEALLRLLRSRFGSVPAGIGDRLKEAAVPELDRWLDRVLDAGTLDDVFRDP